MYTAAKLNKRKGEKKKPQTVLAKARIKILQRKETTSPPTKHRMPLTYEQTINLRTSFAMRAHTHKGHCYTDVLQQALGASDFSSPRHLYRTFLFGGFTPNALPGVFPQLLQTYILMPHSRLPDISSFSTNTFRNSQVSITVPRHQQPREREKSNSRNKQSDGFKSRRVLALAQSHAQYTRKIPTSSIIAFLLSAKPDSFASHSTSKRHLRIHPKHTGRPQS